MTPMVSGFNSFLDFYSVKNRKLLAECLPFPVFHESFLFSTWRKCGFTLPNQHERPHMGSLPLLYHGKSAASWLQFVKSHIAATSDLSLLSHYWCISSLHRKILDSQSFSARDSHRCESNTVIWSSSFIKQAQGWIQIWCNGYIKITVHAVFLGHSDCFVAV